MTPRPFCVARQAFTAEKPTSWTEISNYNEHITHRLMHLGTRCSMTAKPPPDAALLDLFRAELETHLGALNEGLLSLEKSPNDAKRLESLMRAAHSIKGAAKVVGFDAAVQVSHHLEDCFVAAQRGQLTLTSDGVDVLLRGVDALNRLGSTAASASGLTETALEQLIGEITAVRAGQPPTSKPTAPPVVAGPVAAAPVATPLPSSPPSQTEGVSRPDAVAPDELAEARRAPDAPAISPPALYEFVAEAKEHLIALVQDLLALEQNPHDANAERVDRLFRAMHSVKGGAGFLGCQVIEELAHTMENVLEELRQAGIAPGSVVVDALLLGTDRVLALLDNVARSNEADVSDVLQRLRQCLELPPASVPAVESPHVADTSVDRDASAQAAANQAVAEALPATAPPTAPSEASAVASRGPEPAASVRIPVPLVDRLMTLAGELVLVRNQALRSLDAGEAAMRPVMQRLDALTSQLQGAVTQTRMQPVGNLFAKFPRMVRDLARQLGKTIELEMTGTEVELDKSVLELLSDPLTHLLRNCCDHGLESPADRARAGKPLTGRVTLAARHLGGQICIEVGDDGQGIDGERMKRKALQAGLRTSAELARLSDKEALGLITLPGFSTAAAVTDLSGRGVGMDVVKTNLDRLGGTLEIDSIRGQGSTFALRVPLTLAIIPCLMVRAGDQRYAIPQKDLEELVCLHPEQAQLRIEYTLDQEVVRLRDQLLPLVRLPEVLGRSTPFDAEAREAVVRKYRPSMPTAGSRPSPRVSGDTAEIALACSPGGESVPTESAADDSARTATMFFAVVKVGARRFGLVVDEILKNEEIVVKPMHDLMKPLACFSGATILGDGRVALILNMEGLAQHGGVRFGNRVEQRASAISASRAETTAALLFTYGPQEQFAVPLAMIRRLVMIDRDRIERVGQREFVLVDGTSTPLLRLDHVLPVSAGIDANPLFLLLPNNLARPLGLLVTSIIDTETLPAECSRAAFQADGVVGSAILRGRMTLLLDVCRLADLDAPTARTPAAGPAAREQKRILAVDDTEFFRELARGYLETEGYTVVTAANGAEALHELDAGQFDLVVSDIEMPVMDGWTLAQTIRQRSDGARLPLLALTTLCSDADRARAKTCGFDAYEVKLDRQGFLSTVAELLGVEVPP